jgi:guanyl-specific ribonuclease Sa
MDDGRGGGEVLPRQDASDHSITYWEWDVNPYTGANRGAERLVTGSDGSAWYTSDHYATFVRIR